MYEKDPHKLYGNSTENVVNQKGNPQIFISYMGIFFLGK
jgi:hypothetical protein